jgi:hypothetical protein
MCKRQIRKKPAPPKPCNDNEPRAISSLVPRRPIAYRAGILAAALERTERVRLDVLAAGVLTIQGQYPRSKKEKRPSFYRAL